MKIISQERARDEAGFKEDYVKVARTENIPFSDEKARELREFILKGDFDVEQKSAGYNLKMMLDTAADTGITLANLNWQILWAPESQLFLTADNPVISILPGDDRRATIGVGFARPGVEVYFALSAQACLRMGQDLEEDVFDAKGKYVRQVNSTLMFCAGRFTYAPERNAKLKKLFDKVGCQLVYGETAFVPPWKGIPGKPPAE
jgi:hypothetical protein